jgi:hypothetical protein
MLHGHDPALAVVNDHERVLARGLPAVSVTPVGPPFRVAV